MSTYNFRKYSDPDVTFAGFLDAHRSYLGVPTDVRFASSNEKIYEAFQEDISLPYVFEVAFALRRIRVLIYNGQDDFVVNTPGVLAYINGINWEGIPQWKRTTKQIWTIHG
jgi:vitellogenic carboxypeptidase-like protein